MLAQDKPLSKPIAVRISRVMKAFTGMNATCNRHFTSDSTPGAPRRLACVTSCLSPDLIWGFARPAHFVSSKTAFTLPLRTARSRAAWSLSFWSA